MKDPKIFRTEEGVVLTAEEVKSKVLKEIFDDDNYGDQLKKFKDGNAVLQTKGLSILPNSADYMIIAGEQKAIITEIEEFVARGPPDTDVPVSIFMRNRRLRSTKGSKNNPPQIDSPKNKNARGNYGEIRMDLDLIKDGWIPLNGDRITALSQSPGDSGIDGLYAKIGKNDEIRFLVTDAKTSDQFGFRGTVAQQISQFKLTKNADKLVQLSNKWASTRIQDALIKNLDLSDQEVASAKDFVDLVLKPSMSTKQYERAVFGYTEDISKPNWNALVDSGGKVQTKTKFNPKTGKRETKIDRLIQ